MIRFLLNLLKVIISVYLCAIVLLFAYFAICKELYDKPLPMIEGYSYIKLKDDNMKPKFEQNEFVLVQYKAEQTVEVGDYVVYLKDEKYPTLKQVTAIDDYLVTLNYTNIQEENTINFDQIIAKEIYSNAKLSKVLFILTNPIALIVMLVSVVLIPELTFRRF